MYNDLFSIGPIMIHGYGLMIAIGVLVGLIIADKRATARGLNGEHIYGMTVWTLFLGFCAAKVLFIITYFKDFLADPISFIRGSGFVVFGGLIGGVATIFGYCKINKMNFIDYIDIMVPSVAIAQGFGRIGCLLAGCCYGRVTDSAIGIVFKHSDFAPNNVKLLPTQIMMSIGDFIIAAILFWFAARCEKKIMAKQNLETKPCGCGGRIAVVYFILYSIGRFFIEFFRNDYRGSIGILSTSQFIGIIVTLVGCAVYYFAYIKKEKAEDKQDVNV